MSESTKTAVAVLAVIALAAAFWLLLLAPKRDKANELSAQTTALKAEVASEAQASVEAVAAKQKFPGLYRQMVLLGKAVPAEAATPSLLVQLNGIGKSTDTSFQSIALASAESAEAVEPLATEGAASLLPLGAGVGPSGLPTMSYTLQFEGGFFQVANFIQGLDSLVETKNGEVDVHGRLVTIDGFGLVPSEESGAGDSKLQAAFQVTTYVAPPGQGLTAGATTTGPATTEAETETP
jgi:Tfp pilus assembly protein PilO